MIQLFLVRHGECEGGGTYVGRGSDVHLTDSGIKQIQSLGKYFSSEIQYEDIDCIYTSTMIRARESAEIISSYINIPIIPLRGMEENDFGDWEGLSYKEIIEKTPHIFQNWLENPQECKPPNGETLLDLKKRVMESCSPLFKKSEDDKIRKIIIVSHKGPLTVLLTELMGLNMSYFWNFRIDRGSLSKVNISPRFSELEFLNRKF